VMFRLVPWFRYESYVCISGILSCTHRIYKGLRNYSGTRMYSPLYDTFVCKSYASYACIPAALMYTLSYMHCMHMRFRIVLGSLVILLRV